MKSLFGLILLAALQAGAQTVAPCSCSGFVDLNYRKDISISKKPGSIPFAKIGHDFTTEDYLIFDIDKTTSQYFHVNIAYSIGGKSYIGWVRKSNKLQTYLKGYSGPVKIFVKPNLSASNRNISPRMSGAAAIADCKGDWIRIKNTRSNSAPAGWIRAKDQCSNPYTTCN